MGYAKGIVASQRCEEAVQDILYVFRISWRSGGESIVLKDDMDARVVVAV